MSIPQLDALRGKVQRVLSHIRLEPFDVSTEAGRAQERHRRASLATVFGLGARLTKIATAFLSVPLTIHYLGPERYGMWMTMSSLLTMLVVMDLGVSNGLVNPLTRALGQDEEDRARALVSSATFLLLGICAAALLVFLFGYGWVPWADIFNVHSPAAIAEAKPGTAALFGCILATILFGLIYRINQSLQRIHVSRLWETVGNLLSLGSLIACVMLEASLPWLVLSIGAAQPLGMLLSGGELFGRGSRRWLWPRWRWVSREQAQALLTISGWFLLMNIAYFIIAASSNVIIAHRFGSEHVQEFAVPLRIFVIINMFVNLAVMPLWPAYVDARARGDHAWVSKTVKRSLKLALLVSLLPSIVVVVAGRAVISVWVGDAVSPTLTLLIAFALWQVILAQGTTLSVFLNGVNKIRAHALIQCWRTLLAVIFQLVLAAYTRSIVGVVFALALSELFGLVLPAAWIARRTLKNTPSPHQESP